MSRKCPLSGEDCIALLDCEGTLKDYVIRRKKEECFDMISGECGLQVAIEWDRYALKTKDVAE